MIKINSKLNTSDILSFKNDCSSIISDIEQKITSGEIKSTSFKNHWTRIKPLLYELFNEKCCYCESSRTIEEFNIDHYRPKMFKNGRDYIPGYWWLAYDPTNYLLLCPSCNRIKSTNFPLIEDSHRCICPDDNIKAESPYILNPMYEDINIDDYIEFKFSSDDLGNTTFEISGIDPQQRGQKTIEVLKLNRASLLKQWKKNIKNIEREIKQVAAIDNKEVKKSHLKLVISNYTNDKSEFSALNKAYFKFLNFDIEQVG